VGTSRVTANPYCLLPGDPPADAVSRILTGQVSGAINLLSSGTASFDDAVHDARRFIKRARSLLRLIRPAIGSHYLRENRSLRAAARRLSKLRDAQAVIESLLVLEQKEASPIARLQIRATRAHLVRRKQEGAGAAGAKTQIRSAVAHLKVALRGIPELPLQDVDLQLLNEALETTVERGRKASSSAWKNSDPEKLHELRKRVKDLRHQADLLAAISPRAHKARGNVIEKLDRLLGDNQNLNVLRGVLGHINLPESLRESIEATQATLHKKARRLTARLYDV
jgi:CHAD domain-containing protein